MQQAALSTLLLLLYVACQRANQTPKNTQWWQQLRPKLPEKLASSSNVCDFGIVWGGGPDPMCKSFNSRFFHDLECLMMYYAFPR
eukprot:m.231163 g.231163  ORF g.231163 m.231163 type:complete len:85 (+) comp17360_c0_seq25:2020-2274(+)